MHLLIFLTVSSIPEFSKISSDTQFLSLPLSFFIAQVLISVKYQIISKSLFGIIKSIFENFDFLSKIPNLEILAIGFGVKVVNSTYPIFKSIIKNKKIKKLRLGRAFCSLDDYAFVEVLLGQENITFKDSKTFGDIGAEPVIINLIFPPRDFFIALKNTES